MDRWIQADNQPDEQPGIPNATDAWSVYRGHYQAIAHFLGHFRGQFIVDVNNRKRHRLRDVPLRNERHRFRDVPLRGRRAKQRLTRQIRMDWEMIQNDHPTNHVRLKAKLRDAIRHFKDEAKAHTLATDHLNKLRAENRAANPRPRDIPQMYEGAMRVAIGFLAAAMILFRTELRIGAALTTFIRAQAQTEIDDLKFEIADMGQKLARWSQHREQTVAARSTRRGWVQRNSTPAPPPSGSIWYSQITDGMLASVGLCLYGDEHHRIVDRMIMKDVWFTHVPHIWNDPTWWLGDPMDVFPKTPPEAAIMMHLTDTGQEIVVQIRTWEMFPTRLMYRLFVEYCPLRDAAWLMHHHMTLNDRNGNNESHIPEPAIWHIFESLIKAGLVMERGFANRRDERPDRGWQDIVHLDIKPDNVFIGDYPTDNPNKRSENFAMYPTFKLGDFGTSIFRRRKENYPDDADAYWSRGTPYYYAPEQRTQYHGQEYQGEEHPPLNAKTKHPSLDAKTNV